MRGGRRRRSATSCRRRPGWKRGWRGDRGESVPRPLSPPTPGTPVPRGAPSRRPPAASPHSPGCPALSGWVFRARSSLCLALCVLWLESLPLSVTSSSYLPVSVSGSVFSVFLAVSCSGAWVSIAHLGFSPASGSGTQRAPGGFRMQRGCSGWRAQAWGTRRVHTC